MEIYTNQIKEWTDYENQYKIAVAAVKWLDKSLRIVHGKRERNVELTYGLPYTSSGEYAAIWNANVDARSKDDPNLAFKGMALDKDNNPVIIWYMTDCDVWKYSTMKNFTMKWMISGWKITLDQNGDFEAVKDGEVIHANLNSFVSTENGEPKDKREWLIRCVRYDAFRKFGIMRTSLPNFYGAI